MAEGEVAEISLLSDRDEDDDEDVFDDSLTQLLNAQQTRTTNTNVIRQIPTQNTTTTICNNTTRPGATATYTVNESELSTFVYPINYPKRSYQYSVVQSAIWNNTLVALPTGLGKTFIAATIILNHTRWFPDSTILFMAPTRPLVAQQIKACCGIMGISQDRIGIMLDKLIRNRTPVWTDKQIIFTTPQIVENDLNKIDVYRISLVVVDEAHRTRGNYSYNKVCSLLMDKFNHYKFRVLALTATPGSNLDDIQSIIDSLRISRIEIKSEDSEDIKPYIKQKTLEKIQVPVSEEINTCIMYLCNAIEPTLKMVNSRGIYDNTNPERINFFQCLEIQQSIIRNLSIPENLKWSNYFLLQLLCIAGQCLRRLNIYGVHSFYQYFNDKRNEFLTKWNMKKAKNKQAHLFYTHPQTIQLMKYAEELVLKPGFYPHPKLEVLVNELKAFKQTQLGKVIVFAEFRETALNIVTHIEKLGDSLLRPHIFIGQAREKEKFSEESYKAKIKRLRKTKKPVAKAKGKGKGKKRKLDDEVIEDDDSEDGSVPKSGVRTSSEDAQLKGMNQALQREIIKKFKDDVYNVLVCTSIGEEGLDIGEVDLIVCYDSTSSPIKNIQRMGRTGRKRDGRVLLLFSLNEQTKFEKALNDYSNIQKLIMEDHRLQLHPAINLLPRGIRPRMVDRVLEVPKENIQLKLEEDDDEIIKMATQYMKEHLTKSTSASSKGRQRKQKEKAQPQFFLPQGVDTQFTSASSLIASTNKPLEQKEIQGELSSGIDHSILEQLVESDFSSSENEDEQQRSTEQVQKGDDYDDILVASRHRSSSGIMEQLRIQQENQGIFNQMAPVYGGSVTNKATSKRTLGIKRTRIASSDTGESIIEQLQKQRDKTFKDGIIEVEIDDDEEEEDDKDVWNRAPSSSPLKMKTTNNKALHFCSEDDANVFNKSTQEPLTTPHTDPLAQSTQLPQIKQSKSDNKDEDEDFEDVFNDGLERKLGLKSSGSKDIIYEVESSSNAGLLNEDQQLELYTEYFSTIDPLEYIMPFGEGSYSNTRGVVGHSKYSQRLLDVLNKIT
ncbi:3'-5' DNA helicase [Scheffersomyces spartinae]|uniref:ATP-dependent DNA helicase n=1 Tax=Scheffersomyces spartinae TaxID=45513 RepID=A0A9P7V5Y9_9ASCO|nr:3'-5' DNA helicase [Scheffersomyces spartinae]KAG7191833.1 3'-5' DNA helicase [Scheffersomyces spartinae]